MRIEIIFDTICPWCFLGKRRLEKALLQKPTIRATIIWNAFLLNPHLPPEGIDRQTYLKATFGNKTKSNRIFESINEAGKPLGINFQFGNIKRLPNTINSHRFVRFAGQQGRASDAVEALFQAYFSRGMDTGNRTVLYELAEELGFEKAGLRNYFHSNEDLEDIRDQNARAHQLGINGIPAFVIDGEFSISGAQEPQVLSRLLEVGEKRQRDLFASGTQPL